MNEPFRPAGAAAEAGQPVGLSAEQIRISVNGIEKSIATGMTVAQLLTSLRLSGEGIAVALNDRIVVRSAHNLQRVQAGDRLEIVHAVAGG